MLLINPTRKELDKQAIKEDKIKLGLEKDFSRDIDVIFRRILRDLEKSYSKIGLIPEQTQYFDDFEKIIKKYQIKTSEIFSGTLRDTEFKSVRLFERKNEDLEIEEKEDSNIEEAIAVALALWIDEQSINQTNIVLDTNTKEIQEAIEKAREDLSKQDKIFNNKNIVSLAAIGLTNKFLNRSNLIAEQNVGMTAHQSKLTEAETINNSSAKIEGVKVAGKSKKSWNAILDDKTRAAHAYADFRYNANPILLEESFIVMGEALKYPKDPAGSAANIMNCRCDIMIGIYT